MKTLFVLRHAKSSWADATMTDRDRPLNQRGIRDAPRMGRWLAQQALRPNRIVSSPAVRTLTTATVMAEALGLTPLEIATNEQIYEAYPKDLIAVIQGFDHLDQKSDRILLVGHNPGVTELLNQIEGVMIDNVPTCGLATVQFNTDTWRAISLEQATLVSFQYPKQLERQGF